MHHGNETHPAHRKPGPRLVKGRAYHRGPRKAAEPSGDIKARLSQLTTDTMNGNFSRAKARALEIIRINSEIHAAWKTLGSILRDEGSLDKGLNCLVYAAHLRPKDSKGWEVCADLAYEDGNLPTARHCYTAAVTADQRNTDARLGRARVYHDQGLLPKAVSEFRKVVSIRPLALEVVRDLASASVDMGDVTEVEFAISAYRHCLDHSRQAGNIAEPALGVSWADIGVYVELHARMGHFQEAIRELKSLSRWLLGRADESFWDDWEGDDREWDGDDLRRGGIPGFNKSIHGPYAFGIGLPLDLRCRLVLYRRYLGDEDEANVGESKRSSRCSVVRN